MLRDKMPKKGMKEEAIHANQAPVGLASCAPAPSARECEEFWREIGEEGLRKGKARGTEEIGRAHV